MWCRNVPGRREKHAFVLREAQRTVTRLVREAQEIVDLAQGAGRGLFPVGAPGSSAAHENAAPPVRRGITNGTE